MKTGKTIPRHFISGVRKVGYEKMDKSVKEGGNQIEYEDEDPRIRDLYESECARNGVTSKMRRAAVAVA